MAYITTTDLANYLQRALTAAETTQAPTVLDAVSGWIDRYTGRTWVGTSVTGETSVYYGPFVILARPPVSVVTTLTARAREVGAVTRVLVAGSDYELLDAAHGVLRVVAAVGDLITAAYTTGAALPVEVKLAAEMLAAAWLSAADTQAASQGIKAYSVGSGDLSVTYRDEAGTLAPEPVRRLLAAWRRPVLFA